MRTNGKARRSRSAVCWVGVVGGASAHRQRLTDRHLRCADARGVSASSSAGGLRPALCVDSLRDRIDFGRTVCAETELAFFYVLVMGYYPVLRVKLNTLKARWSALDHKICGVQCGHGAGLFLLFALLGPAVLDELWPTEQPCWWRFGRGKSVILAVRPGAGGADAILSSGGQPRLKKKF